jgi:hypothetical protein
MGEYTLNATTVGSAGAATVTVYTPILHGWVHAIKTDYHASAPATTTVVYSEDGGAGRSILSLAAGNTDATDYPQVLAQGADGADLTAIYTPVYISGRRIKMVVALSDALTNAVVATIITVDP